jgi:hypothetical protein
LLLVSDGRDDEGRFPDAPHPRKTAPGRIASIEFACLVSARHPRRTPRSPFSSAPSTRPLIRSTPPVAVSGNALTPVEPPASSVELAQTPEAQIALTVHSEKHGVGLPGGAMNLGASNPNLLIINESPQTDEGPWMSNSGPLA